MRRTSSRDAVGTLPRPHSARNTDSVLSNPSDTIKSVISCTANAPFVVSTSPRIAPAEAPSIPRFRSCSITVVKTAARSCARTLLSTPWLFSVW